LVEYDGNSTKSYIMILQESTWADEYTDDLTKEYIRSAYRQRYMPDVSPQTHPENYDPCNPPEDWRYDPFYEVWIKINE
jgi:hypothetical protein